MKHILILSVSLFAFPTLAAEFVPYQVDQNTHQAIVTYLGDVPSKWANPVLAELLRLEAKAANDKAAADAKAAAEVKPAPPPISSVVPSGQDPKK